MKYLGVILLASLGIFSFSCQNNTANETEGEATSVNSAKSKPNRVEVLDFHTAHRCETCIAIEENTRYTLKTYFPEEVENGTIVFSLINADDEKNIQLVEKYMAYGTSLFINVVKGDEEHYTDISRFAFLKGTEQDAFSKELKLKIDSALVEL